MDEREDQKERRNGLTVTPMALLAAVIPVVFSCVGVFLTIGSAKEKLDNVVTEVREIKATVNGLRDNAATQAGKNGEFDSRLRNVERPR